MILCGVAAIGLLLAYAADLEVQVVDKNCWIDIFEDDRCDAHIKIQGPNEFATLKNLHGKDWANDIESVVVGSNAAVRAYEDQYFKSAEITSRQASVCQILASSTWRTTSNP